MIDNRAIMKIFRTLLVDRYWQWRTLLLLFTIHCSLSTSAQSFTQRLQQQNNGEGTVTVTHDKDIDDLVNGPKTVTTPTKDSKDTKDAKDSKASDDTKEVKSTLVSQQDTVAVSRPRTGRAYKTTGYRIQVYAGGNTRRDRQRAEQAKAQLKNLFPDEAVYVHFYSPRWICRIGNYRTYEEALRMKKEIKQMGFESATIVKGQIVAYY